MDKLRLGVIGLGSVVREIYEYLYYRSIYSDSLEIVAICDTSPPAVKTFGETHGIPESRRFTSHRDLLEWATAGGTDRLDAVAINTPDDVHAAPVSDAIDHRLDVLLPKPLAGNIADADAIVQAVERSDRFLGVDFHKRENPLVREARARVTAGQYGSLQTAVFSMLDKILVVDPNRSPRFFASPDFAARNSPVSFLMSHIADTFLYITGLRPHAVRSIGYRQKLRSLSPNSVDGYDTVDTQVVFEGGATAHFIAGWAIPDGASSLTVQSGRMIFTDGLLDLQFDNPGLEETTSTGFDRPHVLFRTFRDDGLVTGFGMDSPGGILREILRRRSGAMTGDEYTDLTSPSTLGFYSAVICDCAERSLRAGSEKWPGVVVGHDVSVRDALVDDLGSDRAARYLGGS